MKLQQLKKIAKAINKIVDWGIDLLITLAEQFYHDMRDKKRRAIHLRIILVVFVSYVFMGVYFSTLHREMLKPVVKHWEADKVRIEELERKLNEANDEMFELQEFKNDLSEGKKEAIVEYIRHKFGNNSDLALAVADCESHLRANAVGDGHLTFNANGVEYGKSYGVFQIRHLQGRPNPDYLLNAKNNIDYAYEMYERQGGFQAWTCYSAGYYQRHLSSL